MSNIHDTKFGKYYDQIRRYYKERKTNREIIELLQCPELTNPKQISKIAAQLGISKRKDGQENWKKFIEKDQKALELIKNGMSCTQTAKLLGMDQQSMNLRLKKHYGLEVLLDGKKAVNGHYFDDIATEEQAYWLGFMYADGYIGKHNEVELCLQSYDRQHLRKFQEAIGSKHKLGEKRIVLNGKEFKACRVHIKDSDLAAGLMRNGCANNKSFEIEMPELGSKELYRHFIRGFFDGDGHIGYRSATDRNNYISAEFACASSSFVASLQAYAAEIVGVKMTIKRDPRHAVYKVTTTSRWESFRFLQHLYENSSIYLDRKYQQYLSICRSEMISLESLNDEDGIKRGWRNVS